MNITLAPPAIVSAAQPPPHFLTSYLINDSLAIDAGSIGFLGDLDRQQRIKHVLLSHTHLDHLASLPIFLENVADSGAEPVTIYATAPVLDCLQRDLFNDRLWPDFIAISQEGPRLLRLQAIHPGQTFELEGLRITPVAVNHVVPTCGFILEDHAAVVIAGDTGPTEELWDRANAQANLTAVFLEVTFPNSLNALANTAKHLTPALFAQEIRKIKKAVTLIAVHLKARFLADVMRQLQELALPRLEIPQYDRIYQF